MYGALRPYGKHYFEVRVSPASVKRAVLILNAIVKNIRLIGCEIVSSSRSYHANDLNGLSLFNEEINFSIEEKISRSES